uniref:FXYD domain-containing ion transport regulator n=1 Tax=Scophthalmus maximus TaxID=52904 RepID=A0A8D3D893_SCOMX
MHNISPSSLRATYKVLFVVSDYESLRIGGLVFAVVLFLLGIALIVSKCAAHMLLVQSQHSVV